MLSRLLGGLPEIPAAPLASLPERLLPQVIREMGDVEHDGRECRVYGAADTVPATGMRVDYTIAVDDRDIPCFIETERRWRDSGSRRIQRHRRLVHHRAAAGGNAGERSARAGHAVGPRLAAGRLIP